MTGLPEGDLLELVVATPSLNRRVLVMWLYLRQHSRMSLEEFDTMISQLAEKELQIRAYSGIPAP